MKYRFKDGWMEWIDFSDIQNENIRELLAKMDDDAFIVGQGSCKMERIKEFIKKEKLKEQVGEGKYNFLLSSNALKHLSRVLVELIGIREAIKNSRVTSTHVDNRELEEIEKLLVNGILV
jgi:hypothetical protein